MNNTTIDYSEHRPSDWKWMNSYISYMGSEAFNSFLNRVFGRLSKMKVGEIYDLTKKVSSKNRDLFIKIACYYINCGNMDYEFSNDYTIIRKTQKPNDRNIIHLPCFNITVVLERKIKNKEKEEPELSDI